MALSDAWLKANSGKPRVALTEVADRDGTSVRVTPKGKIVFQLRYRYDGQLKRLDLGSYPALNLKIRPSNWVITLNRHGSKAATGRLSRSLIRRPWPVGSSS